METKEKKNSTFTLPNKRVNVKFINRKRGMASGSWVGKDHVIAGGMLKTAHKKLSVPLKRNNTLSNVLTNDEKAYLEDQLNIDLSVYSNQKFWEERYVRLQKGDNYLDLNNPIDYIDYKILLGNPKFVAKSWEDRNNDLNYWFAIVEEGEENKLQKVAFNYKKKAFRLYSEIEDNKEVLRGIIKLINKKPISKETKLDWLQGEVEKIIDSDPQKFVSLIEDSNYQTKILLSHAEDAGIVVKQNRRYMTSDGIELANEGEVASFDNAVRYLSQPINQELVDIIKAKLNKAK